LWSQVRASSPNAQMSQRHADGPAGPARAEPYFPNPDIPTDPIKDLPDRGAYVSTVATPSEPMVDPFPRSCRIFMLEPLPPLRRRPTHQKELCDDSHLCLRVVWQRRTRRWHHRAGAPPLRQVRAALRSETGGPADLSPAPAGRARATLHRTAGAGRGCAVPATAAASGRVQLAR
jgi:hypothetical protein